MRRLALAAALWAAALPGFAAEDHKKPAYSRADADLKSLMLGKALVQEACKHLGEPYVWGGKDPGVGFDCAGFTCYVYARFGLALPRRAFDQFTVGSGVEKSSLQAGDLVFFTSSSPQATMHVGIYEGRGVFIHAPRSGGHIMRSRLDKKYFANRYLGARRLVSAGGGLPTK